MDIVLGARTNSTMTWTTTDAVDYQNRKWEMKEDEKEAVAAANYFIGFKEIRRCVACGSGGGDESREIVVIFIRQRFITSASQQSHPHF